jgi:DNA invertase Pin-like site-specific DNA recombinase
MDRTYRRLSVWARSLALAAALVLIAGAGTSVAACPPWLARTVQVDAGPLAKGAGHGAAGQAAHERGLQRLLSRLRWATGRLDGRFQTAGGLASAGVVEAHTAKALGRARGRPQSRVAGDPTSDGSGLRTGPLDGCSGACTEAALSPLQPGAKFEVTGALDRRVRRVFARGAKQPGGVRPLAARVEMIGPQALQGMAVATQVARAVARGHTVGLTLAVGLAAVTLFIGAFCGALVAHAHATKGLTRPAGPEQEHDRGEVAGSGQAPQLQDSTPAVTAVGPRESLRAVGYVSVPNGDDVAALEAQVDAIQRLCGRRGWELLRVVRDVEDGHAKGTERPGLLYTLERIAEGDASCLVVSHLERLSRSAADLGRIVEWVEEHGGRLVAINLRLDTGSPQGRVTARTVVAIGKWEGRRIADQTKKGLAAARARRGTTGPAAVEDRPGLKERIVALRKKGLTMQAIADRLNAERVPTLRGGTEWRQSSVQRAAGYRRPENKRTILKTHRKKKEE